MLNAAAITELTTESAPFAILDEWLRGYFDGATHAIGNNAPVLFPRVNFAYGQSAPPRQPLHQFESPDVDAFIRVLIFPRHEVTHDADTSLYSGKLVTSYVLFNFWVNAKRPGTGQSELLAQRIAQLLKAILANPDNRFPLAEKGITHLTTQPPQWLPSAEYSQRLVVAPAQLQYPITFGDVVVAPSENQQSVAYFHEAPVTTGVYLLGTYFWAAPVTLVSALVMAWAPQTSPVVIGLEVDGVLTGETVTLPVDVANQEVSASVTLNRNLNADQVVRWKVLSAPAAEDSAWHVALTMQVQPRS